MDLHTGTPNLRLGNVTLQNGQIRTIDKDYWSFKSAHVYPSQHLYSESFGPRNRNNGRKHEVPTELTALNCGPAKQQ